ncbi:MAG TPA: Flp pilus assembly protein CpaB [Pyrinomonadaceae bacterium]|nr:Flp pilus assembly protein CpaB [Pyrinomonadaceae bacterium]
MRNKRLLVVLAGAALFGLVAAVLVSRYLSNAQAYTKSLATVVVAKVDVPAGTKLIAEQLSVAQFPQGATPDGVFETMDKAVGRVTVVNIAAREPLTDFKLAPEGSAGGLSAIIPEGYRAMTVKVDDVVGVSGFLQPGALVDVVVVISPTDMHQNPISKIVLQNVKVLASGQNIDRPKDDREANTVKAVTLQVTPEQAEKLALASTEGKLQLVMRNSVDQGDEQTRGVDKRTLLGGEHAAPLPEPGSMKSEQPKASAQPQAAPAPPVRMPRVRVAPVQVEQPQPASKPAPPPAPRNTVEMIEGGKRRSVEFP